MSDDYCGLKVGDVVKFTEHNNAESTCLHLTKTKPGHLFRVLRLVPPSSIRIGHLDGDPVGERADREDGGQVYYAYRFEHDKFMQAVVEANRECAHE